MDHGSAVATGELLMATNPPAAVPTPGASGGGISRITSEDESITVTDPAGPTTDLKVASLGIKKVTSAKITTTDATPIALKNINNHGYLIRFGLGTSGPVDYTRSGRVRITVIARQTDVPGTSAVFTAEGGVEGVPATPGYAWMGGVAPVFTPAAYNDAGATTWSVSVAIVGVTIVVTVTGADATAIAWECSLELDEISA